MDMSKAVNECVGTCEHCHLTLFPRCVRKKDYVITTQKSFFSSPFFFRCCCCSFIFSRDPGETNGAKRELGSNLSGKVIPITADCNEGTLGTLSGSPGEFGHDRWFTFGPTNGQPKAMTMLMGSSIKPVHQGRDIFPFPVLGQMEKKRSTLQTF